MDRGTHGYHTISRCVKKNDTNTKTLRLAQLEVAICCTHFSHERSNFLVHAPTTSPGYRSGCASGLMIMMMHDASKPIDKVRCLRYRARSTDRGSRNSGEYVSAASSLDISLSVTVAFTISHIPNFGPGFSRTEAEVAHVQFTRLSGQRLSLSV